MAGGDVIREKSVSVCDERFGFDPDGRLGTERKLAVERGIITRRASRGSLLGFPRFAGSRASSVNPSDAENPSVRPSLIINYLTPLS